MNFKLAYIKGSSMQKIEVYPPRQIQTIKSISIFNIFKYHPSKRRTLSSKLNQISTLNFYINDIEISSTENSKSIFTHGLKKLDFYIQLIEISSIHKSHPTLKDEFERVQSISVFNLQNYHPSGNSHSTSKMD